MTVTTADTDIQASARREEKAARRVLLTISFCHMLNDMMQSLLLAIYPMLKASFSLSFGQIGLITLTFQITASLLQPLIGMYTDKSPKNFSLSVGMSFTLVGLLLLAFASSYPMVLVAAAMVGMGSSVFHPESSRIARLASGGRHGFAQSLFQVGGNVGSAIGPLVAAYAIAPHGQSSVGWFSLAALLAVILLATVGQWYKAHRASRGKRPAPAITNPLSRDKVFLAIAVLLGLLFSKYFYMASISSYYTFYLIDHFGVAMQDAQV
jgi:FSR family fosmidomycin resistance protein-like MFS transporter